MASKWNKILYGLEVRVRFPLSLNSVSLCMDHFVWLYEAI